MRIGAKNIIKQRLNERMVWVFLLLFSEGRKKGNNLSCSEQKAKNLFDNNASNANMGKKRK